MTIDPRFADPRSPRPMTPDLDAVQKQAEALAKWEVEQEQLMAEAIERRAAEAKARPERERIARERRVRCEQAVADAELHVTALAEALRMYVANLPAAVSQADVASRMMIFLGNSLHPFGRELTPNESIQAPLLYDLAELAMRKAAK